MTIKLTLNCNRTTAIQWDSFIKVKKQSNHKQSFNIFNYLKTERKIFLNYLVCVLEIFFDSVSCCLEKFTNKHKKGDLSPIKINSHTPVV